MSDIRAEAEQIVHDAYQRQKTRRRQQAGRWTVLAVGVLLGAGLTALMIAAMRWVP